MGIFEAILLGIIQGLTEFLPVSSSGHLAIFQKIFGMNEVRIAFDVFLHLGTLIAVFIIYRKDIIRLIIDGVGILADSCTNIYRFFRTIIKHEQVEYIQVIRTSYRKFTLLVIVSTIPTGIIGFFGKNVVSSALDTLIIPGICLLITAVLLFISDQLPDGDKTPKNTGYLNSIFIGICQGIATLPGLSRSGTTIAAGLLCGLKRDFAVKYSFIMSIPAILGATILEIPDMGEDIATIGAGVYMAGMIVAAIVGYICIKAMLLVVKNKKFKYFSYYCAIMGIVAVIASIIIK